MENILVVKELKDEPRIILMNFEHCTDYFTKDGVHKTRGLVDRFRGNASMASVNAMDFKRTSRRDDLISLTYLLTYMIQGFSTFIDNQKSHLQSEFYKIRAKK